MPNGFPSARWNDNYFGDLDLVPSAVVIGSLLRTFEAFEYRVTQNVRFGINIAVNTLYPPGLQNRPGHKYNYPVACKIRQACTSLQDVFSHNHFLTRFLL